jgi:pre-mRNA-splicing factor 38B
MEQYGNEHFNVERVLRENINGNEYVRKQARALETWEAVMDEMYRTVDHVEPWMSGSIQQRSASSSFCLLYRLFELKLTEEQIQGTITCKDSQYIRAVRPCVLLEERGASV